MSRELGKEHDAPSLHSDSQSVIDLANNRHGNWDLEERSEHSEPQRLDEFEVSADGKIRVKGSSEWLSHWNYNPRGWWSHRDGSSLRSNLVEGRHSEAGTCWKRPSPEPV